MHSATVVSEQLADARAFADSVAGVAARHRPAGTPRWQPGRPDPSVDWAGLTEALAELGWRSVAEDPDLVVCAGLGGVELLLDFLQRPQHLRQFGRLVDFPILLRRQADARPVRPAALVAAAERGRRRPGAGAGNGRSVSWRRAEFRQEQAQGAVCLKARVPARRDARR